LIFPEALLLVSLEIQNPQGIRLGKRWVTDQQGKISQVSPFADVDLRVFDRWFFTQVYAAAASIVLGEPYPKPRTPSVKLLLRSQDALERLVAPESPGAREQARLTTLLHGEENTGDRLQDLLASASPREKELLLLLSQGFSREEAAHAMGISVTTLRVFLHRLRRKSRCR
jgi:hypothetical protein